MKVWFALASQVIVVQLAFQSAATAQIRYSSGQDVVPVYEGWERNPDGTFNMVFGYMNRNYQEQLDIPIGQDNNIEPGPPDQNQPSHFYPRRQEFVFKVKIPADWGDKDLVWTLVSRGKTEKAYGTLKPVYELGNLVYQENRHGAAALTYPEQPDKAPTIEMIGSSRATVAPGQPLEISAEVMDDGYPKPIVRPPRARNRERTGTIRTQSPGTQAVVKLDSGVRLGMTWVVYRGGPGDVTFDPMRVPVVTTNPADAQSEVVPLKGKATTRVTFSQPGTYVLRGYADDGILTTPLDVTVTVADTAAASHP